MMKTLFLSLCLCGVSIPALGYAQDDPDVSKKIDEQAEKMKFLREQIMAHASEIPEQERKSMQEKYITGIGEKPGGWHFSYGPLGEARDKSAILFIHEGNGNVAFRCQNDGSISMAWSLAAPHISHIGAVEHGTMAIASKSHDISAMLDDYRGMYGYYSMTGMDVAGILSTMGTLSPGEGKGIISIGIDDRKLDLPSPDNPNDTKMMNALCGAWSNRRLQSTHLQRPDKEKAKTVQAPASQNTERQVDVPSDHD